MDLYQQLILDHNKNPNNFGILNEYNCKADGQNPLCGDQIVIYILVKNKLIKKISFNGSGCAISKASASIMTSYLKGITIKEANELFNNFLNLITTGNSIKDLGKLSVLAGIYKYPSRVKCATLAWHTFLGALNKSKNVVTTE